MTTILDVLDQVQRAGILLRADGDQLTYDAPAGAMTPRLRDAIRQHKPALLGAFAPVRGFVTLRPDARTKFAPTLPVEAIELGLDLEARGIRLRVDRDHQLVVDLDDPRLTDADRARVARWRDHLGAVVAYTAPTPAWAVQ